MATTCDTNFSATPWKEKITTNSDLLDTLINFLLVLLLKKANKHFRVKQSRKKDHGKSLNNLLKYVITGCKLLYVFYV